MAISAVFQAILSVSETLSSTPGSASPVITHGAFNQLKQLNSSSTPPGTEVISVERTLSGSTDTLDLSAVAGANAATYDLTSPANQRVQAFLFVNKSTNANLMTLSDHGTTGYYIFGDASGQVTVYPGGCVAMFTNDQPHDLSGSNKQLLVTGTTGQTYQLSLVVG